MKKITWTFIPVAAFLIVPGISFSQCAVCFNAATNFAVGSNPYSIVSADFNGDGNADLAAANWSSSNVSILLGTGSGTFGAATNFTVGTNPRAITTADYNGDGRADFATGNDGSNNVSVRLGNGTGGFGAVSNFVVAASPEAILSGDFNADGKIDIITANYGSQNVSVLIGTGTGSFAAAVNYSTGASSFPSGICKGDFNADGKMDIATVSSSGTNVARLLGNGTGGFGAATAYPFVSGYSYSVCSADFNLDGKADLALSNAGTNNASRLTGNGTGGFGAASNYATGAFAYAIASADFNLDGRPDLVTANYSGNNVSVLMGMGTGAFCAATSFSAASSPTSVCSADFNGDGLPDLAVTNNNSNNVSVLLNCSVPLPIELISFTGEQNGSSIVLNWTTATELNNNYFTIEHSSDGISFKEIARVNGAGTSSQEHHYSVEDENANAGINYYRLRQTDFDGQYKNYPILAVPFSSSDKISVFPNPSPGVFYIASTDELTSVQVRNVMGEIVFSEVGMASQPVIDLSGQPCGIYYVEVKSDHDTFVHRIMIMR